MRCQSYSVGLLCQMLLKNSESRPLLNKGAPWWYVLVRFRYAPSGDCRSTTHHSSLAILACLTVSTDYATHRRSVQGAVLCQVLAR